MTIRTPPPYKPYDRTNRVWLTGGTPWPAEHETRFRVTTMPPDVGRAPVSELQIAVDDAPVPDHDDPDLPRGVVYGIDDPVVP